MILRDENEWRVVLLVLGCSQATVDAWAPVFASTIKEDTFSAGDGDLAPFLGQTLVETQMLTKMQENMDYSAERMMAVWPGRFPDLASAMPYQHSPEALANRVYGGRGGNNMMGDGWLYRGRGIPGITFHDGYAALGDLMGQDLLVTPDLLLEPIYALEGGIHWWEKRIPDSVLGDTVRVSRLVEGGTVGLAERERLTDLAVKALA